MNGAESLLRTLVGSGVDVCFGNPGTSEMHFVAALDRVEGMRVAGRVQVERIPYFAEQIVEFMKGTEQLVLVGASPPVSFFAYPNKPSWCTPEDCRILYLAHAHEDGTAALEALADAVKAAKQPLHIVVSSKPDIPVGTARSADGRTGHRPLSSERRPSFPTKAQPQAAAFIDLRPVSSRTIISR